MNIYVGNLHYALSEDELKAVFLNYGEVTSAKIIIDKVTGKSKGFGFVEMTNQEEGEKAIEELNDSLVKGRNMKVNLAKEKSNSRQSFNKKERYKSYNY